jgi:asparagine synthase (glutamine-hydrolysing)
MCGLLAAFPKIDNGIFNKCLSLLSHRGPDNTNVWADSEIVLGHTRLSIIDLTESSNQPLSCFEERYYIIFNGEIYNYLEIKSELQNKGYFFRTSSDTEVVLNSYIEWGEKSLNKFNGMWSFIIWDNEKKELFVSRDRFGKKPLFYYYNGHSYIFSSEMKSIMPYIKSIKTSKNFDWMIRNPFLYESTENTLIEGIKSFPAGYFGKLDKNMKLKKTRFWNLLDNLVEVPRAYSDQVNQFKDLFFDSCKLRLRSDADYATLLSGGLDSSCISMTINEILKTKSTKQELFFTEFKNTPLDEFKYANNIAKKTNSNFNVIKVDPLKHIEDIYHYQFMFEEVYPTNILPMILTYKEIHNNGIKVSIDGHGADELFSGYGNILQAIWHYKFDFKKILEIVETHNLTLSSSNQFQKFSKFKIILEQLLRGFSKDILGLGYISKYKNENNYKKLDYFSKQLFVIFNETVLPTLLRNYDRFSMINSVESRMPFMDHRLVSYIFSLPIESKLGNGFTKRILRDSCKSILPIENYNRKTKIGYGAPMVNWLQNDLKEWVLDTTNSQEFNNSDCVKNKEKLKQNLNKIITKKSNSFQLAVNCWYDLSIFIWEKSFLKNKVFY